MKRDPNEYLTLKPKIQGGLLELMSNAQDERNTIQFEALKKILEMVQEAYFCLAKNVTEKESINFSHNSLVDSHEKLVDEHNNLKTKHAEVLTENEERLALLKKLFLIDPTLANKVSKSDVTKIFGKDFAQNPVQKNYYNLKRVV